MTTGTDFLTATIAFGSQVSPILNLPAGGIVGVAFPAALTGTSLTFEGTIDGVNFFTIYKIDQTTLLSAPFIANAIITIPPIETAAVPKRFRLRTGANEAAQRKIHILHRALS